jgi:hypothetical protein
MTKFAIAATVVIASTGYGFISQETKDAGRALGAASVGEMEFSKGATVVSTGAQESLRNTLNEASAKGTVDHVAIMAWSDLEYPTKHTPATTASVALADRRLSSLETYLKTQLNVSSVTTYNMAKRPNSAQELLHTKTAKVKDTAELEGAAPSTKNETGIFGQKGQASKAVVMVFLKAAN